MANVFEFIMRVRDEASAVMEGIGKTGGGVASTLNDNWLGIAAGGAAAGLAIEGFARSQQDSTIKAQQLAASLGISEQAARDMAIAVGGTGDPMDEMLALLETGRQRGLTSADALKEYAGFWDTVADATGLAGPKLAEAGVALQAVGIAAGEEEKALAAFGFITRETTQGVDEFLNFISRTGPDLRDMGLGVNETAGLLGAMEKELGLSGRAARTQFNEAVIAAEGDLGVLLSTLGLTEAQMQEYTAAVEASGGVIEENAKIANSAFTPLQHLQQQAEELAFRFGGLAQQAASAAPVLMAMGPAIKAVSLAKQGWALATRGVSIAMAFLAANPLVLIVAGIAALAIALVIAYQKSETFRDIVNGVFNAIMSVAGPIIAWIAEEIPRAFQQVLDFVSEHWQTIIQIVLGPLGVLIVQVIEHWEQIKAAVETGVRLVLVVVGVVLEELKAAWDAFWPVLQAIIDFVWPIIKQVVADNIEAIRAGIDTALDLVQGVWDRVWPAVKATVAFLWPLIKAVVVDNVEAARAGIELALGVIQEVWDRVWPQLQSKAETVWAGIQLAVAIVTTIKDLILLVLGEIQGPWDTTWDAIKSTVDTVWNGLNGVVRLVDGAISSVKTVLEAVYTPIKEGWDGFWGGLSSSVSTIVDNVKGFVNDIIDAINGLIGAWNSLEFSFAGYDNPIPGLPDVPAVSIGTPDITKIPRLQLGGFTTGEVFSHLHGNEAIIPLDSQRGTDALARAIGQSGAGRLGQASSSEQRQLAKLIAEEIVGALRARPLTAVIDSQLIEDWQDRRLAGIVS